MNQLSRFRFVSSLRMPGLLRDSPSIEPLLSGKPAVATSPLVRRARLLHTFRRQLRVVGLPIGRRE